MVTVGGAAGRAELNIGKEPSVIRLILKYVHFFIFYFLF